MSFFNKQLGGVLEAPLRVQGFDFELLAQDHETYTYPIAGWYWFDTEAQAHDFFFKPPPEVESPIKAFTAAIQKHLNAEAASRGYGDERTAPSVAICTYVGDANPKFAQEAEAFKIWRSQVWTACHEFLKKVQTGEAIMPKNEDEVIRLLPAMQWEVSPKAP